MNEIITVCYRAVSGFIVINDMPISDLIRISRKMYSPIIEIIYIA
jgi:hypothetical protein